MGRNDPCLQENDIPEPESVLVKSCLVCRVFESALWVRIIAGHRTETRDVNMVMPYGNRIALQHSHAHVGNTQLIPEIPRPHEARGVTALNEKKGKNMAVVVTTLRLESLVEKTNLPWQPARSHHLVGETVRIAPPATNP